MITGKRELLLAQEGIVEVVLAADGLTAVGYTAEEVSARPEAAAVLAVTPWQIRKALNAVGLRAAVETAVAAGSQDMKDGWEFATEVRRDDPLVVAMGAALDKSSKELDELFVLASTL